MRLQPNTLHTVQCLPNLHLPEDSDTLIRTWILALRMPPADVLAGSYVCRGLHGRDLFVYQTRAQLFMGLGSLVSSSYLGIVPAVAFDQPQYPQKMSEGAGVVPIVETPPVATTTITTTPTPLVQTTSTATPTPLVSNALVVPVLETLLVPNALVATTTTTTPTPLVQTTSTATPTPLLPNVPVVPVVETPVDMGDTPPELPGNTHARRHPDRPVIPPRARYRPKEKNSAALTRLRRQIRANKSQAVADDIRDIRQAVEDLVPVVAMRHNMKVKEIRRRVYNVSALKAKQNKVSVYNAQVCCVMESLNEGREFGNRYTMEQAKKMMKEDPSLKENIDPDDLKRMVAKLEADGVLKRTGVRHDNIAAAVDAQGTLDVILELIRGLYHRTGIMGFAFFTRGNFNNVLAPVAMESGDALGFCSEILGREPELINTMLELWAIQKSAGAITAPTTEKMLVVFLVNVNMNFEGYIKSIVQAKHVALTGWPAGVPWKRLGKITNAGHVRAVYKALKDGTCKWRKLTEAEEDEEERRFNKLIKKGLAEEANVRKIRLDCGGKHQTQGTERELRARRTETYAESGDDNDEPEPEPESDPDTEPERNDNEDQPFANYNGDYSDEDGSARRKKAKSSKPAAKSASKPAAKSASKPAAKSASKPAAKSASKSASASKSTTKAKPAATKAKANPATKTKANPATKTKPKPSATKPKPKPAKPVFVPTPAPPRVVMKGGKFVPNGAAIAAHEREMIAARGKHERENRERGGGSDGEGGEDSDGDEDAPPRKKRRVVNNSEEGEEEPEEEEPVVVKSKKRSVVGEKHDREDDEEEQEPVAKKKKKASGVGKKHGKGLDPEVVVSRPVPRPAHKGAPNTGTRRRGPPGVRKIIPPTSDSE
ncbi:hypothetical protein FB45DRAFT_1039805 [Roridomyces roridus]|uniref:Uncharacterized protein n=1 Tax=Roridomyces roridus TaxID=1738132 RepID=A0AAD7B246_9AGAR|nr:hypothetical protein FB45DRAFT_1039805 [Roridomyces roridus]